MSADNGIYILVTRGKGRRRGKEYRVAHAQAIENLSYQPDYPTGREDGLNAFRALQLFGKSKVHTDLKIAAGYAQRMHDEMLEQDGIVEYGVATLDYHTIRFPRESDATKPDWW